MKEAPDDDISKDILFMIINNTQTISLSSTAGSLGQGTLEGSHGTGSAAAVGVEVSSSRACEKVYLVGV